MGQPDTADSPLADSARLDRWARGLPRLRGDQVLGAVLELAMKPLHVGERVDLRWALVDPEPDDTREAESEAGLVAVGALDDVEGDFDALQPHAVVAHEAEEVASELAARVRTEHPGGAENLALLRSARDEDPPPREGTRGGLASR